MGMNKHWKLGGVVEEEHWCVVTLYIESEKEFHERGELIEIMLRYECRFFF